MMIVQDRIYGRQEINEPVLVEIINDNSFQRLKGVSQLGLPDRYWIKKGFTRYEHSIGVLILLMKLGATLEEQVSGVVHDISHSSFSHIADWVFKQDDARNANEDFQDNQMTAYLAQYSNIPAILHKHNYFTSTIINLKSFSLLESDLPSLNADRLDYSLRELYYNGNKKLSKAIWGSTINLNGKVAFTSLKYARCLATEFLRMQSNHWGSQEGVRRYTIFAEILKNLLHEQVITKDDLFTKSEDALLSTINTTKHSNTLKTFKPRITHKPIRNDLVRKKFRYIDPQIFIRNRIYTLSKVDNQFKRSLREHKAINKRGILV